jgi:hypothetical protein
MEHQVIPAALLGEIESYCRATGMSRSTLCLRVLNNSRFFERLEARNARLAREAELLRRFMRDNPPGESGEAA